LATFRVKKQFTIFQGKNLNRASTDLGPDLLNKEPSNAKLELSALAANKKG